MQPGRVLRLLVSDLYLNDAIGNFVLSLADEVPARKIPITVYAERYGAEPSALRTTVTREEEITVTSAENPPPVTARAADLSTRIAARVDNI